MINRALKLTRQFHRLNQTEAAERLDISKSFLSEIEAGKKAPTLDLLNRYAATFGIPASALLLFSENGDDPERAIKQKPARKVLQFLEWAADDKGDTDGEA